MSRIRFFSNQFLDLFAYTPPATNKTSLELRRLRCLVLRAGRLAFGTKRFWQIFNDILLELTAQEIAHRDGCSAETVSRNRTVELRRLRYALVAVQLYDGLKLRGGATIDPSHGFSPPKQSGFLVSVRKYGTTFTDFPKPQQILDWLLEVAPVLENGKPQYFSGVWSASKTGPYCCDLNRRYHGKSAALRNGRKQYQDSIFDSMNGKSIKVPNAAPAV